MVFINNYNKIGKVLFYLGILLTAGGFFKNQIIGIADTPEPYPIFSTPLIGSVLYYWSYQRFIRKARSVNSDFEDFSYCTNGAD